MKEIGGGEQGSRVWGAHAPRVLFPAPSPETILRSLPKRTHQWRVLPGWESWLLPVIMALAIGGVASCATASRHQFGEPALNWQTKSGQLMYRTARTTLTGDVVVRFSKSGDFELNFSKGPGVTLLTLRQDASFAEVKGPFAEGRWSGPIDRAPKPLRGWLGLRDKLIQSHEQSVRYTAGNETFLFRF